MGYNSRGYSIESFSLFTNKSKAFKQMGFKIMGFKDRFSVHFVFESNQLKANKNSMERAYIFLNFSRKQVVIFHFFSNSHMLQLQRFFKGKKTIFLLLVRSIGKKIKRGL